MTTHEYCIKYNLLAPLSLLFELGWFQGDSSGVFFFVNFEHIPLIFLVLSFEQINASWVLSHVTDIFCFVTTVFHRHP